MIQRRRKRKMRKRHPQSIGAQHVDLRPLLSPSQKQAPPPTDPEAVLRARYGGLLPTHKKRGLHKGHLHQHFDSADWSMAKARATTATTAGGSAASSLSAAAAAAAAPLPLSSTLEEVAPPRLAPEPPAPRRASHLGEASKQ